jgi:bifunctional non-homologous end joining protein LigD
MCCVITSHLAGAVESGFKTMKMNGKIRKVPGFVRPMRSKTVAELPTGNEWVYEVKRGGKRTIAVKDGRCVKLFGEDGQPLNCPSVEEMLRRAPFQRAVIDGEIISVAGQPSDSGENNRNDRTLQLFAWDLLHLNGQDLTAEPVERRKGRLCTMTMDSNVLFSPSLQCEPTQLLEEVGRLSLEGVVAKRKGSTYEPGKCSGSWITLRAKPH